MKPFTYVVPLSLAEAAAAAKKPGAVLKAAGIDLVDRLKERIEAPPEVVNLLQIPTGGRDEMVAGRGREVALNLLIDDDGGLRLGALLTLAQLATGAAQKGPAFAAIAEAAGTAATPQVRNRATVAGNLLQMTRCWYLRSAAFTCLHGRDGPSCLAQVGDNRYHSIQGYHDCVRVHPSNLAPALLALDAEYTTLLDGKERRRPLSALFPAEPKAELAEHTLEPGEIVTAIHLPAQPAGARSAYRESREKLSFDWATTAAAARVVLDGGVIRSASLVLSAVAPVPLPRPEAAALLVGQKPSDELFLRAADKAFADAKPLSGNAYKVQVGKAIVRETLHAVTR